MNRATFLKSLLLCAAAPAVVARALAVSPSPSVVMFACTTRAQAERYARWMRQCGHIGNPAWIYYHLLVQQGYAGQIDLHSVRQAAMLCDSPSP